MENRELADPNVFLSRGMNRNCNRESPTVITKISNPPIDSIVAIPIGCATIFIASCRFNRVTAHRDKRDIILLSPAAYNRLSLSSMSRNTKSGENCKTRARDRKVERSALWNA